MTRRDFKPAKRVPLPSRASVSERVTAKINNIFYGAGNYHSIVISEHRRPVVVVNQGTELPARISPAISLVRSCARARAVLEE